MKILKDNKYLLELYGFFISENVSHISRIVRSAISNGLIILNLLSMIAYFIAHIDDVAKATEAMYPVCAFITSLAMGISLTVQAKEVTLLIEDFEEIINLSNNLIERYVPGTDYKFLIC